MDQLRGLCSRRSLLLAAGIGSVGLAGCTGLLGDDNEQEPTKVGGLAVSNRDDDPHTITPLITSPDELVFLGSYDLAADDGLFLEGPWPEEETLLTVELIIDGDLQDGLTADEVATDDPYELGTHDRSGCVTLEVGVDQRGGTLLQAREDDEYC